MATAGSIVIDLLMKTGAFETDSKRAEKRLKEMEATAKKWGAAIGAAGVAAGAAFAAWTVKMAETGKELDRFATLSNSSAESFQRWAYGAQTVGIEQEKLADILKDVQDRVGDFITTGGGPMADFFENIAPKVNLTAEAFRGLSGQEALGLFVSSLEKAGLSQSEMIFYMEQLASDSSLLIPLLRDNATGMKAMGDEAERLGAIMSSDTVAAAKELDLNLNRLQAMVSGVSTTFANTLLPTLGQFVENVIDATVQTDDLRGAAAALAGDKSLPDWANLTGLAMARTADAVVGLIKTVDAAASSFQAVWADIESILAMSARDASGLSELIAPDEAERRNAELKGVLEERNRIVEEANRKWSDLWTYEGNRFEQAWMKAVDRSNFDANFVGPQMPTEMAPISVMGSPAGGASKQRIDEGQRLIDQMNERIALLGKETEYEKLLAQMSVGSITFRTQAQRDEALAQAQTLDFINEQSAAYEEAQKYLSGISKVAQDTSDQLDQFAIGAARSIQQSLGDGLYDVLAGNFDGIGQRFSEMIFRMAADAASANLAQALFGDFGASGQIGGLLGNLFAGFFSPDITASSGYMSGGTAIGSLDGLTLFADGGYTGPGGRMQPAGIVHAGEYVMNANATRRLGLGILDRLNGYADGGFVGAAGAPAALGGAGLGGVEVNLVNQSSQPMDARASAPRFDGERYVVDVVLKDLRNKGPIRRQLENI